MPGASSSQIRAGAAFVEMGLDDTLLRSGLEKAKKLVRTAGAAIAGAGAGMIAIGGSIKAGLAVAMDGAVDHITQVRKASEQLNISTEAMSGLGYAAAKVGLSLDDVVASGRHLGAVLSEAAQGGGNAELLERMGVATKDLINQPADEWFKAVADGLKNLPNDAERSEAAMKLLGRGGAALEQVMRGGSDGLAALAARAKDMGAIVSTEDAAKAKAYTAAIGQLKEGWKYLVEAIGAAVIPAGARLKEWSDRLLQIIQAVRRFVDANREIVLAVSATATGLIAAGGVFVAIGGALAAVSFAGAGFTAAIAGVGTVLSTIMAYAPVIAIMAGIAAAIVGIGYAIYTFTPAGDAIRSALAGIAETAQWAWGVLKTAWEGISAAFEAGDLQGALGIARAALDVFWAALKYGAQVGWNMVKEKALDAFDRAVGAGAKAVLDIKFALQDFGTDIKGNLEKIWANITKGLTDAFRDGFKNAINIASVAFDAMINMHKRVGKYIRELITNPSSKSDDFKDAAAIAAPGLAAAAAVGSAAKDEVDKGSALAAAEGIENAKKILEEQRKKLRDEIDAATKRKIEARHADDIAEADKDLANLKKKEVILQEKSNAMMQKALATAIQKAAASAIDSVVDVAGLAARKQMAMTATMAVAAQSSFSGLNAGQVFGSRLSTMDKIAENTKRTADGIDVLNDKPGGIPVN